MLKPVSKMRRRWPPNNPEPGWLAAYLLFVAALADVARRRLQHQIDKGRIADKSPHSGVLSPFDRVRRGLALWTEQHDPEVGFIFERADLRGVATRTRAVCQAAVQI